jgi:DNA-directed RNA polymerase sigma subunit (sigma70/sigma32)
MDVRLAESINTFGTTSPKANVPQSEPVFILTSHQLKSIIQEAIQPLQDEVSQLLATVATQGEKIATLESTQDTQAENQLIQLRLIHDLKSKKGLPLAEATQKTQDHITEIAKILEATERRLTERQVPRSALTRYRSEGVTFSELARVMGLTVDRIRQLSRIAATDQRFNICWHPRKKNTKIFKLRRWDAPGL